MTSATDTTTSLAERLRAFAEHLGPVSNDYYYEEIGTIIEAATALDALTAREEAYREALTDLMRAYVSLLETGYRRIIDAGGTCDPVDVMERNDPALRAARQALCTGA